MNKEQGNFVTVLSTGKQADIAVAKSILEAAGIRYFIKGEGVQDLFGYGRLGSGFNPITGPIKIQVSRSDEKEARELLEHLSDSHP